MFKGYMGFRVKGWVGSRFRDATPIMENDMEMNKENEMETVVVCF